MSIRVMSWVWENSRARGTDRLVLLAIADHASDDGTDAYPSIARLVRRSAVDERTVQRSIRRLANLGELSVAKGAGMKGSNRYTIDMTPRQVATPPGVTPLVAQRHPPAERPPGNTPPPPAMATQTPGAAPPTPRQSATQTVLEPTTNRPTTSPDAARRGYDALFDEFWSIYPRREAKGAAKVKFVAALKRGVSSETIKAGAERYRDDPNREPAFTAHPTTWLNQGRWDDEALPPREAQAAPAVRRPGW